MDGAERTGRKAKKKTWEIEMMNGILASIRFKLAFFLTVCFGGKEECKTCDNFVTLESYRIFWCSTHLKPSC